MALTLSTILLLCVIDVGCDLINATKVMHSLNGLTVAVVFNYIEVLVMFGICSFIEYCTYRNS